MYAVGAGDSVYHTGEALKTSLNSIVQKIPGYSPSPGYRSSILVIKVCSIAGRFNLCSLPLNVENESVRFEVTDALSERERIALKELIGSNKSFI